MTLMELCARHSIESVWVTDRIAFPTAAHLSRLQARPLDSSLRDHTDCGSEGGHAADRDVGDCFLDAYSCAAFLAAHDSTVRIGTSVALASLRNIFTTARTIATLDRLSGGRFVHGVGMGHVPAEYDLLGLPYDDRKRLFEETLAGLVRLWTDDPASYDGRHVSFEAVRLLAACSSAPFPPMLVGGNGLFALRTVAALGQGWLPAYLTPAEVAKGVSHLRELPGGARALAAGGVTALVKVRLLTDGETAPDPSTSGRHYLTRQAWQRLCTAYHDAGCVRVVAQLPTRDATTYERQIMQLAPA